MKLHRYVDHQRLHIVTKDVISLSISVLLLFRHYISHKITFGAPSSGGVLCSACGAFILSWTGKLCAPAVTSLILLSSHTEWLHACVKRTVKVQLPMALHDSLFHMTSEVTRRLFLTVSNQVRLKHGCV